MFEELNTKLVNSRAVTVTLSENVDRGKSCIDDYMSDLKSILATSKKNE